MEQVSVFSFSILIFTGKAKERKRPRYNTGAKGGCLGFSGRLQRDPIKKGKKLKKFTGKQAGRHIIEYDSRSIAAIY